MAVTRVHEQEWVRLGARTRLAQLRQEMSEILRRYPDLRRGGGSIPTGLLPKRRVSRAARKAMSDGMRRFWARRKAAQKG